MTKPTGTLWVCVVATLAGVVIGFIGGAFAFVMETASAGNLKPVWADAGHVRDWLDPAQGQGVEYLRRATQVKTIWLPYGA